MFIYASGERYRILLEDDAENLNNLCYCHGVWAISIDKPSEPVFFSEENLKHYERIAAPDLKEVLNLNTATEAQKKRYYLIEPLLEDSSYIYDKKKRQMKVKEIAEQKGTTVRRINRLLFRYWATGTVTNTAKVEKNMTETEDNDRNVMESNFHKAIQEYYFSAHKMSLRDAYDQMLIAYYILPDGTLPEDIPSFNQFRKFYYRHNYNRSPRKIIARDGLSAYQRNQRPLSGSAMNWRKHIGSYQLDATEADI